MAGKKLGGRRLGGRRFAEYRSYWDFLFLGFRWVFLLGLRPSPPLE